MILTSPDQINIEKLKVIAFDLDGTLTNPERGLTLGFAYGLKKMGIKCIL